MGGTKPVRSGRNKNRNKSNLKIRSGLFGIYETSFQADLQNSEYQRVSRKYKMHIIINSHD